MRYQTLTLILFFLFSICGSVFSQNSFRVMFYNVENLFDTENNPDTDDNEYLPSGSRRWTSKRYNHKLQQIAKVIHAVGEWDTPAIIGLCEIENEKVIRDLLTRTSLRNSGYQYCLTHSRDPRGLNIALLYQQKIFYPLGHRGIRISFTHKRSKPTRDILHVWGTLQNGDTLDILINHFPSRYGGEKESERGRLEAAQKLKHISDSLHTQRLTSYQLIMGDFNDMPENKSISSVLAAKPITFTENTNRYTSSSLYNLRPVMDKKVCRGTHKYQGEWTQLDQLIVNGQLLNNTSPICLKPGSVRLFSPAFLLTKDKTWHGFRPKRTHYGFKYEGGYSDHLPIIADFLLYLSIQQP